MNAFENEKIVPEKVASPSQLRILANIGIRSAAERNRLRHMKHVKNAHFFYEEVDFINDFSPSSEVGNQMRHRMAGRVGVKTKNEYQKTWSFRLYDTYSVQQTTGEWKIDRTLYSFRWSRLGTELANRACRIITQGEEERDLSTYLNHLSVSSDLPDMLHMESELAMVTREDCDLLINDTHFYFSMVDDLYHRIPK